MQPTRLFVLLFGLLASATATAGFVSWKEESQCVGAYQGWNFSWLDDPAECDTYKRQYINPNTAQWYTHSQDSYWTGCIYVGTGTPYAGTNYWRTRGVFCGAVASKNSNWVYFYPAGDCHDIP